MKVKRLEKETEGCVSIVLASVLFGTMGILAKIAFPFGISPVTLIALRLAFSSLTLASVLLLFSKGSFSVNRADLLCLVVFGLFGVAMQRVSYFYAVDLTTATVAAMLFYTYPVFAILLSSFFHKEKVGVVQWGAIALTLLGVSFVSKVYDPAELRLNSFGIMFGVLSSLLFTVYFLLVRKLRRTHTSLTLTLYGDGIGALALLPIIVASAPQISSFPVELWLIVLAIAWVPSLLAYVLYSHGLKYVKASNGAMLNVIEPISAGVLSTLVISEVLEGLQIVGICVALLGVILLFRTGNSSNASKNKVEANLG